MRFRFAGRAAIARQSVAGRSAHRRLAFALVGLSLDGLQKFVCSQSGKFWFALNQSPSQKSKIQTETRAKIENSF